MTNRIVTLVLSGLLGFAPLAAHAQYDGEWAGDADAAWEELPPPEPPAADADGSAQDQQGSASVAAGQWIFAQQYGWIWMPYGDAYSYVPSDGYGSPYAYVYYPVDARWTWIAAPWIWGIGPWPYFGAFGPARFAWYGHGWWRNPSRWHYAPAYHRGGAYAGRPAPAPHGGRGSYASRAGPGSRGGYARPAPYGGGFPGSRGGYARPAPHGDGFRGAGPARAFAGSGRGGGYMAPRGSPGRGGFGFGGSRSGGGGGGGRGHASGGGRGHR